MVKNTTGGSKSKGQARKFTGGRQSSALRISKDELELYGMVQKMCGNGMFHVLCIDGKTRLGHIRGKFRGRGKRDNLVGANTWVLIGLREWDDGKEDTKQMGKCDLLEVYSDLDKETLKTRVPDKNWTLFANEEMKTEETYGFVFQDENSAEYEKLIEQEMLANQKSSSSAGLKTTGLEEEEEIDIDDI
jgi:translation initiation factor 1A